MLAACHALVGRALHLRHLRPSRWLTGTLAVLAAAWFAALIVPGTPWALLELPVLIGVCLVALRHLGRQPPTSTPALIVPGTTWEEFLAAGGEVSGFRERRWKTVQQMKPGDYLLCYLTGISRWIGVLEVVSQPFKDTTPIWKDEAFPARVRIRSVATLSPETAVPVFELRDELTVFRAQEPQRLDRPFSRLPGPLEAGRRPGRGGRHP